MLPVLPNPHDHFSSEELSTYQRYFTIENAIDHALCDELIELGSVSVVSATKKHTYSNIMSMHHCFLDASHKIHQILESAWADAINHFNIDVTFVEPYKLQRYQPGDYFGTHIDNYHGLNITEDRKLTLIGQLTDGNQYEGGQTCINMHKISRKKGSITFFPSFYPHRVEVVNSGTRWALIGWGWGPYWK